jgi:hypothetical protein
VAARVKFNYEAGPDGNPRPYLWLDLTTESGASIRTRGLLDTGADVTIMDAEYAQALQLDPGDLEEIAAQGPAGVVTARRSVAVVRATLPGAPEIVAPLYPLFTQDMPMPLWGRDFMAVYSLALDQRALQFSLFAQEPVPSGRPNGR